MKKMKKIKKIIIITILIILNLAVLFIGLYGIPTISSYESTKKECPCGFERNEGGTLICLGNIQHFDDMDVYQCDNGKSIIRNY